MRVAMAMVLVVGCYGPHPQAGSPCSATEPCPESLMCSTTTQTCEVSGTGSDRDAAPDTVSIVPDGCVPIPEICGDGIDQNCDGPDATCPMNDAPSNPRDVTAGGMFTDDLSTAHDDAAPSAGMFCGSNGGRDLFYKVTLAADEVYYIDTFGSSFDTVLRTYPGPCLTTTPGNAVCHNNNCSSNQSQFAGTLTAGDNCIVVDQYSSAETTGSVMLHVERGGRNGTKLSGGTSTVTGDTCAATDVWTGSCGGAGKDVAYYAAGCPMSAMTLTATTCNASTTWNTAIYVRRSNDMSERGCNNDDANCTANLAASTITSLSLGGAHLFWVVIDGNAASDCGTYALNITLN
jgi:hypothetical protein